MRKKLFLLLVVFSIIPYLSAQVTEKSQKETLILISTELGDIKLKLFNETQKHRDNFINLLRENKYDSSIFHRVIPEFMIQGGGGANINVDLAETIPSEILPKFVHVRGALAAARMGDNVNPERKSSGSQFYIVQGRPFSWADLEMISNRTGFMYNQEQKDAYLKQGGAPHLDGAYTIFGQVIEGMEVVDKIASVERNQMDKPLKDIKMTVRIINP